MLEISLAKNLCVEAHRGQKRKDRMTPYYTHPFAVAERVPYELKSAAYLHDVLEDTDWTAEELSYQFKRRTMDAVIALTRNKRETYKAYISRVMENPDAVLIKIADMEHNLACEPSEHSKAKIALWLPVLKEKALRNRGEIAALGWYQND